MLSIGYFFGIDRRAILKSIWIYLVSIRFPYICLPAPAPFGVKKAAFWGGLTTEIPKEPSIRSNYENRFGFRVCCLVGPF
jgi:hypothetical protein